MRGIHYKVQQFTDSQANANSCKAAYSEHCSPQYWQILGCNAAAMYYKYLGQRLLYETWKQLFHFAMLPVKPLFYGLPQLFKIMSTHRFYEVYPQMTDMQLVFNYTTNHRVSQGRTVNDRAPEYSGVKGPTSELFWGLHWRNFNSSI